MTEPSLSPARDMSNYKYKLLASDDLLVSLTDAHRCKLPSLNMAWDEGQGLFINKMRFGYIAQLRNSIQLNQAVTLPHPHHTQTRKLWPVFWPIHNCDSIILEEYNLN